jgi:hypothetical protein
LSDTDLAPLLSALGASETALKRDIWRGYGRKGDWGIRGKFGHIYINGDGFLLLFGALERGEQVPSSRPWEQVKRTLSFCKATQDGDWEGCLHLDHLPTEALGIRKRRSVNPSIIGRPFRAKVAA